MVYIFYGNGVIKCCRHMISKQKFAALAVVLIYRQYSSPVIRVACYTLMSDLPTITHWAWMYMHNNLLKHPRTLEFNPHSLDRLHQRRCDSLVPERVPSSSRTPGYEATLLLIVGLRNYCAVGLGNLSFNPSY